MTAPLASGPSRPAAPSPAASTPTRHLHLSRCSCRAPSPNPGPEDRRNPVLTAIYKENASMTTAEWALLVAIFAHDTVIMAALLKLVAWGSTKVAVIEGRIGTL